MSRLAGWAAAVLFCALPAHAQTGEAPATGVCSQWFRALDEAIERAGVRDTEEWRIPGFAHLRTDRFHASFADEAARDAAAFQALGDRLLELDARARQHEIANLGEAPLRALPGLREADPPAEAWRQTRECGRLLRELDIARPQSRQALAARVRELRDEHRSRDPQPPSPPHPAQAGDASGWTIRYSPPLGPALDRAAVAAILRRTDRLGIPQPTPRELVQLAATFAPVLVVETRGDADRFGELGWSADGTRLEADTAQPAVYVKAGYERRRDRLLLQLHYTVWFAGRLDALAWRVSLSRDGEPIAYDALHAGGSRPGSFPLPPAGEGGRAVVFVDAGTHAIRTARIERGAEGVARYTYRSHESLRSLKRPDGGSRGAFGAGSGLRAPEFPDAGEP